MFYKIPLTLVFFLFCVQALCQQRSDFSVNDSSDADTKQLIDKYLSSSDSAEAKINELMILAIDDANKEDYYNQIKKLQIALVLESYVSKPCTTTFNLNYQMANVLARFSPRYALVFYNKAIQIGLKAPDVLHLTKSQMYGAMSGSLIELNEYDSALAVYQLAAAEINTSDAEVLDKASAQNNIGMLYDLMGKYDSALVYYNRALSMLDIKNDKSLLVSSIFDNMAQLSEHKGDFEAAIKTYLFNDSVYAANKIAEKYAKNKVKLLAAMDKALKPGVDVQIKLFDAFIDSSKGHITQPEIVKFYKYAVGHFLNKGNSERAIYFGKRYINLSDSIAIKNTETQRLVMRTLLKLQAIGFRNELHVHELELQNTRQSLYYDRLVAIISVASGIVVILLLTISLHNRKKKHQAEKLAAEAQLRTKELEANAAKHDLELKKKDITNLVLYNTQVYDANKAMIESLQQLLKKDDVTEQSIKSKLLDLKNVDQLSDSFITIQNNIELLNAEFYEKLREKFPKLTKSEMELCGYVRINLSNKDIAILRNVEANSIKMSKTRLRKKLSLSPDDDIYDFVQNI